MDLKCIVLLLTNFYDSFNVQIMVGTRGSGRALRRVIGRALGRDVRRDVDDAL